MRTTKSRSTVLPLLGMAALTLLTSCGLARKAAVKSFVPIIEQSVESAYRDRDLATIEAAIPGNLLLMRGLCESGGGDDGLWALTTQLYFAYAMGFIEDTDPDRARLLYAEGLRLGREGLWKQEWFRQAEQAGPLPDPESLRKMEREDVPLLFWTVANWAGWVGVSLSDPEAVAQLPRAQVYLERILELQPEYFEGMPHAMAGAMMTIRPRMFGGDPEGGREHFEQAFRISERRMLMFQVLYARHYCRQVLDEECFDQTLREVLESSPDLNPEYRLFNEVARRQAGHLMEIRDELF